MPRHRHSVDSFALTTAKHIHPAGTKHGTNGGINGTGGGDTTKYTTAEGGGQNTGTASPYTNYVGNGTAFNNMPPYIVVNIWKRLS
ncbi:hypothetical protein ABF214_04560 [Fusobacterium sp. THCT1E1]